MKTNKFWFVMAVAAILTSMTMMTSCSKDDEPELPEVIESEVLDEGIDATVKENVGTEGTQLSYESWIVVKGQTRAAFENKVAVTLNNSLGLAYEKIDVKDFTFGSERSSISYKLGESKKEGFVTVKDSILVYTVSYEGFSFNYELIYQVPVYNDGFTEHIMPYHRYGKISSNGGKLENMEDLNQGDTLIYQRKMLKHSINVEFNGKEYVVLANLVLQKVIGGTADVLISAKVVDQGTEISDNQTIRSWVKIRKERSLSGIEEFVVSAPLKHSIELPKRDTISFVEYKYFSTIGVQSRVYESDVFDHVTKDNLTTFDVKQRIECDWSYSEGGASFISTLYYQKAVYEDKDITAEMPYCSYQNIMDKGYVFGDLTFMYTHDFAGVGSGVGDMYGALLVQKFSYTFNGETSDASMEQMIKVLKWVK